MNIFKNEKRMPARYFARHIKEGLVHYLERGKDNLYLVTNEALKKMNKSFEGKPIYVRHVEEVDLENLRETADGYVVKSFYNEFDGAWWAEIMIVSDEAHSAVEKGWAVSNAYLPTELGSGGVYHDINYQKEVKNGRYEHLAIVDNPRYEEAVIMTPEEFQTFNESRKAELEQLKNSKENEMLSKEEMDALVATLQNSLADTIKDTVKNAVKEEMDNAKKNAEENDHRELIREIAAVAAKDEENFEGGMEEKIRTIIGLAEKLGYSKDEAGKNSKQNELPVPTGDEEADSQRKDLNLENSEEEEEEKKEDKCNESDEEKEEEEKKENSKFFSMFKNAKSQKASKPAATMASGLALGRERYGSNH